MSSATRPAGPERWTHRDILPTDDLGSAEGTLAFQDGNRRVAFLTDGHNEHQHNNFTRRGLEFFRTYNGARPGTLGRNWEQEICMAVIDLGGSVDWSLQPGGKILSTSTCTPERLYSYLVDACDWPTNMVSDVQTRCKSSSRKLVDRAGWLYLTPKAVLVIYLDLLSDDDQDGARKFANKCGYKP